MQSSMIASLLISIFVLHGMKESSPGALLVPMALPKAKHPVVGSFHCHCDPSVNRRAMATSGFITSNQAPSAPHPTVTSLIFRK